ncbi:MAG: DUF3127 domain-containing protein [Bacteroidia bacterium]|nr:DUF3127 domain-containing protein [Bacteroidia bacterium]
MKLEGKIHAVYDAQQVTATFKKREFVIDYRDNPLYPQYIKFECIQDKCDMLDAYNVGDEVEVSFNLKGREWTNPEGKKVYFNTLDAWRISRPVAGGNGDSANAQDLPVYNLADIAAEDKDDLPF